MAGKKNKSKSEVESLYSNFWLRYSLYALAVGTPLLYSQLLFGRFDLTKMAFMRLVVVIVLVIWLYQSIKQKRIDFVWSKADLLLPAFFLLAILSTILSVNIWVSLLGHYYRYEGLFTFLNYALIYFFSLQVFRNKRHVKELSLIILVTAYLIAGYGILQYFGVDPLIGMLSKNFESKRIFSTLGNPVFLGGYLAMILPVAAAMFIKTGTAKNYLTYGAGVTLIGTALLLTFSRGAWLAAIVGLFYLAYQRRHDLSWIINRLVIMGAIFLLIFVIFIVSTSNYTSGINLAKRIKSIGDIGSGSMATRLQTWESAAKIIQSRPLLGYGPDTFRYVFQRYETLAYAKEGAGKNLTDNAHSYPLHLAAGVGLPAAITFFIFIIWRFYLSIKVQPKEESDASVMYQGFKAGLLAYAVYLLVGISVIGATATFAIIFGVAAGATDANINFKSALVERNGQVFIALTAAILLVALLAAVLGTMMLAADTIAFAARNQAKQAVNETVAAKIRLASRLYPGNGIYLSDLGYYYQRYPFGDKKILLNKAAEAFNQAIQSDPLVSEYHLSLGRTYFNKGDIKLAVTEFKQAIKLRPRYVSAHYWLGVAYYQQRRYKSAIVNLLAVQQIAPGHAKSYDGLADSYKALGNRTKAKYYHRLAKEQDSR